MSYRIEPDKSDLAKLAADLNRLPKAFDVIHQQYTLSLTLGWKEMILGVPTVDTMRYFHSVAARQMANSDGGVGTKEFVIDTSQDGTVGYSDIVERGRRETTGRSSGALAPGRHPGYAGRYVVDRALTKQHNEDLLDKVNIRVLDRYLHG